MRRVADPDINRNADNVKGPIYASPIFMKIQAAAHMRTMINVSNLRTPLFGVFVLVGLSFSISIIYSSTFRLAVVLPFQCNIVFAIC